MHLTADALEPFLTAEFSVACVSAAAVAEIAKRLIRAKWPAWYASKPGQSLLQIVNILAGVVVAGLAFAGTWRERFLLGLCAGLLSHFVYSLVRRWIGGQKPGRPSGEVAIGNEEITRPSIPNVKVPPEGP